MTNTAISPGRALPAPIQPHKTYLQQVTRDALRPILARIGLGWIIILALAAAFAPFIANSYPIAVKLKTAESPAGQWISPLYEHLEPADVVLPVVTILASILIFFRRLKLGQSLALIFWAGCLVFACAAWPQVFWKSNAIGPMPLSAVFSPPGGYFDSLQKAFGLKLAGVFVVGGILLIVAWLICAPIFLLPRRALAWTACLLAPLLILIVSCPIRPALTNIYEQYRDFENAGQTTFVLRTIIPFSPSDRQRDLPDQSLRPPSRFHLMGTDPFGGDVLSRMIHASRIALSIGFIATGIAVVVGVIIGGIMGYFVGVVDLLGMRVIEIFEAIPTIILLVTVTAFYGRSLYLMMVVIGLKSWTGDARFIRAEFLRLRNQDFVQAAIALGLPLRSILFRHMLPNGISPVLVSASFGVASAILLESSLSFIGLGLVDQPSWGQMLDQATKGTGFTWWMATFPGLAIFLTVFAYNLVGESLRDALDPKLKTRE